MAEIPESFWRLASASAAKTKASWAAFQTGEGGRTKTIISVDNDEALVILWALEDYIEKHRREYNETTEGADHRGLEADDDPGIGRRRAAIDRPYKLKK